MTSDRSSNEDESSEYDAIVTALEDLRRDVESDHIAETRLEGLYDEATTSDPRIWNTVTAFIDVEDGEAVVTDESKLAEGWWSPEIIEDCDAMITVDVQPGVPAEAFESIVTQKLVEQIDEAEQQID
ncbi:hypothetical protein ACLI4Z_03780 [Natrialbaceae archaeon A-arb3/5]